MFYTWLILLSILLFLFGISCVYALIIWIRRRKYTKERFAFAALGAIVLLATTFLTSVLGNTMPWDLVAIVFNQVRIFANINQSKKDKPFVFNPLIF